MVRIAFFDKQEPLELETKDGKKMMCQCGLSKNFPFCDASHEQTKDEEEKKVYQYMNGERQIIGELGGGCCGEGDGHCHDKEESHHGCGCHEDAHEEE